MSDFWLPASEFQTPTSDFMLLLSEFRGPASESGLWIYHFPRKLSILLQVTSVDIANSFLFSIKLASSNGQSLFCNYVDYPIISYTFIGNLIAVVTLRISFLTILFNYYLVFIPSNCNYFCRNNRFSLQ